MSRFYGEIQGGRGKATCQGTEKSGIHGHIRGWDLGVEVHGRVDGLGHDVFTIYITGGSNRIRKEIFLGHAVCKGDDNFIFINERRGEINEL